MRCWSAILWGGLVLGLSACGGHAGTLHLLHSADAEGGRHLGKFVPDEVRGAFDESVALEHPCGKPPYIEPRQVAAWGVLERYVLLSPASAAALGVTGSGVKGYLQGTLGYKMVAKVDAAKLEECCRQHGNCPARFINETLSGNIQL